MTCKHCDRPIKGKGLCSSHYDKLRRWGDPLKSDPRKVLEIGDTCKNGHAITEENSVMVKHTGRYVLKCLTCKRIANDEYRERKRLEAMVKSTVTNAEGSILGKQPGIDLRSITIKSRALPYWEKFQDALENDTSRNCNGREAEFIDYEEPPTAEEALELCNGCPLLLQCRAFSTAEKPGWGVWGGKVFGEVGE